LFPRRQYHLYILPGHPLIGQPLSIILVDGDSQDSSEPCFDNVRLDNVQLSSVPEPVTWLLVAGSLVGLGLAIRGRAR